MNSRRVGWLGLLWLSSMGSTLAACDRPGCNGAAFVEHPNAPVITNMRLVEQLATDPWATVLAVDYLAPLADMDNGNMLIYIDGDRTPVIFSMAPLLSAINQAPAVHAGQLGFRWEFAQSIQDGQGVRLAAQLQATSGLLSNCYAMDLYFRITAGPAHANRLQWLWQRTLALALRQQAL